MIKGSFCYPEGVWVGSVLSNLLICLEIVHFWGYLWGVLTWPGVGGGMQGCTPLHVAAHQGHAYAVSRLARAHGCEINAADEKGRTAMHHAAGLGHNAVVMELWARSNTASLEAIDHIGATGLL